MDSCITTNAQLERTILDLSSSLKQAKSRCRTISRKVRTLEQEREALSRRVADLTREIEHHQDLVQQGLIDNFRRLATAAELKDRETGGHLERIGYYAAMIALACGHDREYAARLLAASQMHDIGKIGIPDRILKKRGNLTESERTTMRKHTEYGYRILHGSEVPVLKLAAEIALTHHERYNGGGYPHGHAGDDIPVSGRIVAIADVFDALTMGRSYRQALPIDHAMALMEAGREEHFDPALLDGFFGIADRLVQLRALVNEGRPIHPSFRAVCGYELPTPGAF